MRPRFGGGKRIPDGETTARHRGELPDCGRGGSSGEILEALVNLIAAVADSSQKTRQRVLHVSAWLVAILVAILIIDK